MKIFRLIHIFLRLRKSGIFYLFIENFNPLVKPLQKPKNIEKNFKETLESLGPFFIKLGQLISTRTDLISLELAKELRNLTDNCAPVDFNYIKDQINEGLGSRAKTILENITEKPVASASLAQVHRLTIDDKNLVIKVQKPGLLDLIDKDIKALRLGIRFLRFMYKGYPRVNLNEMLNSYEKIIKNELDFRIEAANAKKTFENFDGNELLYIPRIEDEFTTKKILVMEYIDGIPITDIEELKNYNLDLKKLSENGVKIFLKQVFEDNFFHADMHPGNIFAAKINQENPYYFAVDYAICGSITESNQILIAQMISCLVERDFFSLAQLFIYAEWVAENTKTEELESVLRAHCERLLDKPLSEILFGELLLSLFDAMKPFDLYLDQDLLLLVKTLIHIEGMGRQIYPELDFWSVSKPFIDDWISEKYSVKGLIRYLVSKKHILTYMILKKIEETKDQFSEDFGDK
tara:strand:- start:15836 stop:17224 length:1389 start_codon:yes stop_codon:yes gene_type:complete